MEMDQEHTGRLWRTKDVMWYLQCSKTEVWRYIRRMGLPCFKIGNATSPLRFRENAVKAWEQAHEDDVTRKVAL